MMVELVTDLAPNTKLHTDETYRRAPFRSVQEFGAQRLCHTILLLPTSVRVHACFLFALLSPVAELFASSSNSWTAPCSLECPLS
jgi:hypothetical protein